MNNICHNKNSIDFVQHVADLVLVIEPDTSASKQARIVYQHIDIKLRIFLPTVKDKIFPETLIDWIDNIKDN